MGLPYFKIKQSDNERRLHRNNSHVMTTKRRLAEMGWVINALVSIGYC